MQRITDGDVTFNGDEHRQPDGRHLRHHHHGPDTELNVAPVHVAPLHQVDVRRRVHVDQGGQDKDAEQENGVRNGDGAQDEEHGGVPMRAKQHDEGENVPCQPQQATESRDPDPDNVAEEETCSVVLLCGVVPGEV